ncbi:DNA modification methylase [Opitutaceae bacterium TAV1]|nr:DNA modification methylase [Opitutaceae bacterium TAV1]
MTSPHRFDLSPAVTLYRADCRDVLPALSGIDAVVSDPPYGMDWDTDSTRFSGGHRSIQRSDGRADWGKIEEDADPFDPAPWLAFPRVVLFGANHYASRLPVGTTLVWVKKHEHLFGTFLSDAEIAWMKGGHGVYVVNKPWATTTRMNEGGGRCLHPTQKPVAVMLWCMERAKVPPGGLVLDPYMGSGTTALACIRSGRRFVGIEKNPAHFRTALDRIRGELAQGDLFRTSTTSTPDEQP